jgi:hypothetical protein
VISSMRSTMIHLSDDIKRIMWRDMSKAIGEWAGVWLRATLSKFFLFCLYLFVFTRLFLLFRDLLYLTDSSHALGRWIEAGRLLHLWHSSLLERQRANESLGPRRCAGAFGDHQRRPRHNGRAMASASLRPRIEATHCMKSCCCYYYCCCFRFRLCFCCFCFCFSLSCFTI